VVPCFHWHPLSTCRPLRPREVRRLLAPSSFTDNAGLRLRRTSRHFRSSPPSDSRGAVVFGVYIRFAFATTCRFACPPVGADRGFPQPTRTFTSGLSTDWSPAPPPDITTGATGQVPLAGLSPARTPTSFAAARRYLCESFPECLGPCHGGPVECTCLFLPPRQRPSPVHYRGRLPAFPRQNDFMTDRLFETAAISLCSGPQVCSPPRSSLPLRLISAGQPRLLRPS